MKTEIKLLIITAVVFATGIASGHFATYTKLYNLAGDIYFDPSGCKQTTTILSNGKTRIDWYVVDTKGNFWIENFLNSQSCADALKAFHVTR